MKGREDRKWKGGSKEWSRIEEQDGEEGWRKMEEKDGEGWKIRKKERG